MPERQSDPKIPRGWLLWLFRLPVWLYRCRLGWLLGDRFLLLHHTGRVSGRQFMTVLEVVRHDRVTGAYVIAAGFGERSDWLRNLAEHPETSIQVGRRLLAVRAVRLPAEKAGDELVDYQRRHPDAFSALARLLGYRVDGSEADARAMSAFLPFVALQPLVPNG